MKSENVNDTAVVLQWLNPNWFFEYWIEKHGVEIINSCCFDNELDPLEKIIMEWCNKILNGSLRESTKWR